MADLYQSKGGNFFLSLKIYLGACYTRWGSPVGNRPSLWYVLPLAKSIFLTTPTLHCRNFCNSCFNGLLLLSYNIHGNFQESSEAVCRRAQATPGLSNMKLQWKANSLCNKKFKHNLGKRFILSKQPNEYFVLRHRFRLRVEACCKALLY